MADETLLEDGNSRNIAGAVTDNAAQEIRRLRIDDTTKGLKVMIVGGSGSGTVTSITQGAGILLSPSPITTTGSISLATAIQPIATLGSALQSIRVNAGATALEYYTPSVSSGTVTSVSVITANGVSGVVATATTTPAITLTLGAITPTSVNAVVISGSSTPTLAVTGTSSISGSNTGDQTITLTGDVTGTGTGSFATTVAKLAGVAIGTPTGTTNVVFSNSPTLVTPALGTPTALVGTNITGTATGFISGSSNALQSATTTVNTSSATAPTSGQVLTATSGTAATWQTPSSTSIPKSLTSSDFSAIARFATSLVGTGTVTVTTPSTVMGSGSGSGSSAQVLMSVSAELYNQSPLWTGSFDVDTVGTTGSAFMGIGQPTVSGTGHTYTVRHIGFKILCVAGVDSLYATQADGTTENASAALTTLTGGDRFDLIAQVNGSSSVDYYWRKNGGALSSATNLTSNMPSTTFAQNNLAFSVSNNSTAANIGFTLYATSYQR